MAKIGAGRSFVVVTSVSSSFYARAIAAQVHRPNVRITTIRATSVHYDGLSCR
jgi:hypothetical protein